VNLAPDAYLWNDLCLVCVCLIYHLSSFFLLQLFFIILSHCLTFIPIAIFLTIFNYFSSPSSPPTLSPTVNFINNLRTNFSYETSFRQLFSRYMYVKKTTFVQKICTFMLMKLTPTVKLFFMTKSKQRTEWTTYYLLYN